MSSSVEKVSILGQDTIHVGLHLTPHIAHTVLSSLPSSTYALITDSHLASLHLSSFSALFTESLAKAGSSARFLSYVVPPGEGSKSRQGKVAIEDWLLGEKCTRDTVLLAMGGGVIGDLVGFVAATFMRGIRYVQIPTTLLAMVDSSVGGKTAVDTPAGKNLIGAFWQPSFVFIDAAFLGTLPQREFANGMAEVVKTAAIWDADEFSRLESRSSELLSSLSSLSSSNTSSSTTTPTPAQALLLHTIRTSVYVKAHIVTLDERETGLRNLVNFGHTIGHAIEAVLTPEVLHGEAVSVGIVLEAEVARARGVLGQVSVGRLVRCLSAYGLPTSMADPRIAGHPRAGELTVEKLLGIMALDKKNSGKEKKIVLLSSIGKTLEEKASTVSDELIARTLAYSAKVVAGRPEKVVELSTPGSKSISNRALVLAALSGGTTRLGNLLHSDDTAVMMAALSSLKGAKFEWEDGGETLVVHGNGGKMAVPKKGEELYLGNAGTAARFLTAVCALVGKTEGGEEGERTIITGNKRMKQRPIGPLVDALTSNGASVSYLESQGCLPLSIAPEGLKGGRIELAASVSSQYVSAVLLCAPYAREQDVELALVGGEVISQPYIDMTVAMMRSFGVSVTRVKDEAGKETDVYRVPRGTYKTPGRYEVESDASSATYPLAIAAITGTEVVVKSIGTASLQGDARFAKEVLEPMGCEVVQTENETRVKGPPVGTLRALGEVDMEVMTDAFLTASVLAAVAQGETKEGREVVVQEGTERRGTRILGIKNQRVKECNRIRAMIDELGKFGVHTKELDDGLEIYGMPIQEMKEGVVVHCYDDHRVAMAHSVLATVVKGTVLDEKRCVEKTWPNWWDDLENKIGLKVEGVELPHTTASTSTSGSAAAAADPEGSVLIIGMRGSGKTFIGALAAQSLSWSLLDADAEFERIHNIGVREYVHTHGWPAFRAAETTLLNTLLAEHPTRTIISLGGGIVETPEAREVLKKWAGKGKVVRVVRDTKEVVKYLGEETARPAYGESVEDVVKRREPWYKECCTHEYVNVTGGGVPNAETTAATLAAESVRREVSRFFGQITGVRPNLAPNLASGKRSFFLSLTFPDVTPALAHIDELAAGADALELRVDLLRDSSDNHTDGYAPSLIYVATQVALLRRATDLPLVYTVRTKAQGGSFPDSKPTEALALLELGLRLGVEYLDVEVNSTWPKDRVAQLLKQKGSTQIIGSWHDWTGSFKWDSEDAEKHYAAAAATGDIVKIVGTAKSLDDNFALRRFVAKKVGKPLIAINMGKEGQLSRVLNETFSPVTHARLPAAAAPGQMTVADIHATLALLGQVQKKEFYLFGEPIQHSPSPTLHNTAFGALGLPHVYGLLESANAQDERIKDVLKSASFGGASVTIPLKETIIPLLDKLSEQAKAIGAVNTIIPINQDGKTVLKGENTDWEGIVACVRASRTVSSGAAGLVIGAGGTARAAVYALIQLGIKEVYIYNRTAERAQAVRDAFPGQNVVVLEALGQWTSGNPPSVIIGTVPADAQDAVVLQGEVLLKAPKGVLVEMAYKPARTPLVARVEAKEGWAAVRGVEVLIEQGLAQQRHWTGRRPPRVKVGGAVREFAGV